MKRLSILFVVLLAFAGCKAKSTKLGTNLPSGNGVTTAAKSVSVAPASDAVFVVSGSTLTVTATDGGFATSALQTTGNASLSSIDTKASKLTQPTTTTAVTKSDSTDTTAYCTKGFWVGTAGDVAVLGTSDTPDAGSATTLKNIPSGSFVPGSFFRIMSTNTTASNIVCFGP
jgi:hypothetical protein